MVAKCSTRQAYASGVHPLSSDPQRQTLLVTPQARSSAGASDNGTAVAIRKAALRLFADRGYEATTMKAIAHECGIGASAIYNHVESKQALLREIVRGTIQELIDKAHEAIDSSDDIEEQLRLAVRGHVAFHAERRYEMVVGNHEIGSLEEPARTRQVAYREEYVSIFERLIGRGCSIGCFTTRFPRLAAFAILQMGMGVAIWYREGGDLTPSELGDVYAGYALSMVKGD